MAQSPTLAAEHDELSSLFAAQLRGQFGIRDDIGDFPRRHRRLNNACEKFVDGLINLSKSHLLRCRAQHDTSQTPAAGDKPERPKFRKCLTDSEPARAEHAHEGKFGRQLFTDRVVPTADGLSQTIGNSTEKRRIAANNIQAHAHKVVMSGCPCKCCLQLTIAVWLSGHLDNSGERACKV